MVRKSLGHYFSAYFRMPHLDRSDLERIEKTILSELKPARYQLACQGVEYDRVEEIPLDLKPAATLVIYTHAPCLRLKLTRSWAELYAEDNNPKIDPAIRNITAIVSAKERRALWLLSKYAIWTAPLVGFGSVAFVTELIVLGMADISAFYPTGVLLFVSAVWWAVGYRASLFQFSRVDLGQPNSPSSELPE